MKRIGIFGGTFDPIHTGHLIAIEQSREILQLDEVILVPAKIPPHKFHDCISSEMHRLNIVRLAVQSIPDFTVSDLEISRGGISYSIDTVRELSSEGRIILMMGHDSFQAIETWRDYLELFKICQVAVMKRPGFKEIAWDQFGEPIRFMYPGDVLEVSTDDRIGCANILGNWKICIMGIHGLEMSASTIRDRVKNNRTIKFMSPDPVIEYIERNRLYKNGGGQQNAAKNTADQ